MTEIRNREKLNKLKLLSLIVVIAILIFIIIMGVRIMNTQNTTNAPVGSNLEIQEENVIETKVAETEIKQKWEWEKDTLENHNIDLESINSIHNTMDSYPINAEIIIKDGYIVDEYYKEGYDETSIFTLQSVSKSITSLLVGIAIDKGYIESVDIPISNYFPQILESDSDYLKQITIWHLLTHTSGFSLNDTSNWEEWRNSENWVNYILNSSVTSRPGTVFDYFTGNTHLLSAILQQATGKTAYEFGKEYVFDPLDMESVECETDAQGISDGGNGFAMNVYDMAKIGQLYLNKGTWEGEQIVSEQWIEESTKAQFERSSGSADYGYQWWVRTFGDHGYNAYFAQGHWGQYIFVVPDLNLVVVMTSHYEGSSSIYWQLMNQIVNAC